MDEEVPEVVSKPDELLALHEVTAELFSMFRAWFDVPEKATLDLTEIDSAVVELGDPQMIAALAMRKLQALRLLAMPGVRTTTDVVVAIVNDLERAMFQAPAMRLTTRAAATDWDAELARLDGGDDHPSEAPAAPDVQDVETERFRALHTRLRAAALAVVEASGGEIRVLE